MGADASNYRACPTNHRPTEATVSRVWPPTLLVVSTRAAPSSQPGSTSFAPTTQRQPNRQTPALQRKHTTTRQAQPAFGTADTPNASLPVIRQPSRRERQPNRQTPALQRKRTTTRQAQPASGIAVSTRAARSSRPGSTSFGGRDSPVISAPTRSMPWKTAIKIEGFVRLSDISLNQACRNPDTDHRFLLRSTSDTPGNMRRRNSKNACGDRVDTFGHTESIPIPTQARGISI